MNNEMVNAAPSRKWVLFNLNQLIRFRITDPEIRLPQFGFTKLPDGRYEAQAWAFMNEFGPYMVIGKAVLSMDVELEVTL